MRFSTTFAVTAALDDRDYSCLRTFIGSTIVARRAGRKHAAVATQAMNAATETSVTGSVGRTLKSSVRIGRVRASAPATPITSPASVSFRPCPVRG